MEINLKKIYEEVALRSYYAGELPKKGRADLAMVQTSADTEDMLYGFAKEAFLEVAQLLGDRLEVTAELKPVMRLDFIVEDELKKLLLEEEIHRYIYSYTLLHWLLTAYPQMAEPFAVNVTESLDRIYALRTALAKKVRRRGTELAGI